MQRQPVQKDEKYVYILSRLDLPPNHLCVQVAHASIAATISYGRLLHPIVVVLTVANEQELTDEFERLKEVGVPVVSFREEDMGHAMTAIATGPICGEQRRHFRKLKLLR